METQASQDFMVTPTRVLNLPAITFFYVTCPPVAFADLDKVLDPLLEALYQARQAAPITSGGPDMVRYYKADGDSDLYTMEVGLLVEPDTKPAGGARVKQLPPYHCAAVILWGSLEHIVQAYEALGQAMKAAGLQHNGEVRECTFAFEAVDSPNNLMAIYMGISI